MSTQSAERLFGADSGDRNHVTPGRAPNGPGASPVRLRDLLPGAPAGGPRVAPPEHPRR